MGTVYRRGQKWQAQIKRRGYPVVSKAFITKAAARAWMQEEEARLLAGVQGRGVPFTLGDAFTRYAAEVSPKHKGEKWEKIRLTMLGRDPLASIKLTELRSQHLADWRDRRLEQVKPGSVRREMGLIAGVVTVCRLEWGWLTLNPFEGVKRPRPPRSNHKRVSDDEAALVVEQLKYVDGEPIQTLQQLIAAMFLFAIETAMRDSEIRGILEGQHQVMPAYVQLGDTKNSDARRVPLSKRARQLLDAMQASGKTINDQKRDVLFRRARDAAGVDFNFHSSRHEAICRLAKKIEVLELAKMTGHRNINELLTYYSDDPDEIAKKLG